MTRLSRRADNVSATQGNAGRFRFVEAGVGLRIKDLDKAEAVIKRLEHRVRTRVPHVERVLIQVEPVAATHMHCAVPLADPEGRISPHFGSAPYFALVTVRQATNTIETCEVLRNPFRSAARKKGLQVANWLIDHKIDVVLSHESLEGKGPWFALGDAGVEMHQIRAAALGEALEAYLTGRQSVS